LPWRARYASPARRVFFAFAGGLFSLQTFFMGLRPRRLRPPGGFSPLGESLFFSLGKNKSHPKKTPLCEAAQSRLASSMEEKPPPPTKLDAPSLPMLLRINSTLRLSCHVNHQKSLSHVRGPWSLSLQRKLKWKSTAQKPKSTAAGLKSPIQKPNFPIIGVNSPILELNSPILEMNSPILEMNSPILEMKFPILEVKSPILEMNFSILEMNFSIFKMKSLVLR
jgi:hypothetical protein